MPFVYNILAVSEDFFFTVCSITKYIYFLYSIKSKESMVSLGNSWMVYIANDTFVSPLTHRRAKVQFDWF
jgi:hypothetical protein